MKEIPSLLPEDLNLIVDQTQKISALDYLGWFKEKFDKQLLAYLSEKREQAKQINPEAAVLIDEIIRFSENGGKRVRPAFLYSGYVATGGQAHEAILYASMSVELLHVFALIHDDIIDKSDLRRGAPTTHKAFEKSHQKRKLVGDSKDYGLSAAILAGDLAFSFAEDVLTTAPFPQERVRRARLFFDQMKEQVIYGEYLDVLGGYKRKLSEDEVLQILEFKTAKYTVERPLQIGAILAGADVKLIDTFSRYGIPFGQAFQLQDDIVGTFGSEKEIGKPNDSDIKEGKKTVLLSRSYEQAGPTEKKLLDKWVGNKEATKTDIDKVREIMLSTGSYDYCRKLAKQLLIQAYEAIKDVKLKNEGKGYLISAVEYLYQRI